MSSFPSIRKANLITQVTGSTFEQEVLESMIPVLVDFFAPWCSPCKMVNYTVEQVAKQYQGIVKVVKVNTDENLSLADEYRIRSLPTLMIFQEAQLVNMNTF